MLSAAQYSLTLENRGLKQYLIDLLAVELGKSEATDEVQYFHLVSTAVEEEALEACPSLGSWLQPSSTTGPQPRDGCSHVLEYTGGGELGKFTWTAPECGCVTIRLVRDGERDGEIDI